METETFSFNAEDLSLSREAFACVMGYDLGPIPSHLNESLDDVLTNGGKLIHVKGGYEIINPVTFDQKDFTLLLSGESFDIKRTVFQQLKKAEKLAVFVCTAGNEIIERSRELMKEGDYLKGYVYDVYGSLAVEESMDLIQDALKNKMELADLRITNRYSPGYCGWDVSEQKKLFSLLPDRFCGVELTDSCLMRPIKSVSGIIGIGKSVKFNPYTCNLCDEEDCLYRNLRHKTTMSN